MTTEETPEAPAQQAATAQPEEKTDAAAPAVQAAKPKRKPREKKTAPVQQGGPPPHATCATVEEYVAAYNDMVPTAVDLGMKKISTVKMFGSTTIGKQACDRLHAAITKARNPAQAQPANTEEKETTTMAKKTSKSKSKTNARKAVKGKTTAKRGPRVAFDENAKISWAGKEIPFRGEKKERYEVVRKHNGKTVKTFVANKGNTQTLRNAVKAKLASVG